MEVALVHSTTEHLATRAIDGDIESKGKVSDHAACNGCHDWDRLPRDEGLSEQISLEETIVVTDPRVQVSHESQILEQLSVQAPGIPAITTVSRIDRAASEGCCLL